MAAPAPARWPATTRTRTTLGVAAARHALAAAPGGVRPGSLWFATVSPAYLDKTNATAVHAALRLARRAGVRRRRGGPLGGGALRAGRGPGPPLVVAADIRTGLPGRADEARAATRPPALLVGRRRRAAAWPRSWHWQRHRGVPRPLARAGRPPLQVWEERFGEARYVALGAPVWDDALKAAGWPPARSIGSSAAARTPGPPPRWVARLGWATASPRPRRHRRLHRRRPPGLLLADALDRAAPGEVRRPGGAGRRRRRGGVSDDRGAWPQDGHPPPWPTRSRPGAPCPTARRWPGGATCRSSRPPARAGPASASAAPGPADWKFGFVGSQGDDGTRTCRRARRRRAARLADAVGTIVTFTVDRLAYSPCRRSCSRSSTSTAVAACRSSSPTSTPPTWPSAAGSR